MIFLSQPWTVAAIIVVFGVLTIWAGVEAVKQREAERAPRLMTWADVHDGLPEISPAPDTSTRHLDEIFGGHQTGAWPMIFELRKETPALAARERFCDMRTVIEGTVVERGPLELTVGPHADYPAIRVRLDTAETKNTRPVTEESAKAVAE